MLAETATSWTLVASGIQVVIRGSPYGLTVFDGEGTIVLESESDAKDGYSGLAWARGEVSYERLYIAGYTSFSAQLDAWSEPLRVIGAQSSPDELTLTLRSGSSGGPVVVATHRVRESALRVEARLLDSEPVRAWAASFQSPEAEGFLGFGERFNRTDQRGKNVWSWIEEGGIGTGEGTQQSQDNPFPGGELMTYYAVPFFLSTQGYGFWLDTSYRSEFNLATEHERSWRAWHVGPSLAYEVYVPKANDSRPWPYHVIDSFTETTGRPMLPPPWALGPRRRVGPRSMQGGQSEIQTMRDLDLCVTAVDDAMHFYPSGSHIGREAEIREWISSASRLGYRVSGYYNSFVDRNPRKPIAAWAAEGRSAGYYVRLASGEHPDLSILTGRETPSLYLLDFTNPAAAEWYSSSFDWALDLGYSGWMYDFGEYLPAQSLGFDGTSGEALHNQYPVLYAKALHDALEKSSRSGDWLAFQRSGYTGTSAYVPFVWSGDPAASFEASDGLPSMVPAGVNLGISGAPHWGGDIGGFHCIIDGASAADAELLTRWIQMGSMTSNMMDQSACVGAPRASKASIWSAPEAMAAWKEYGRLHTRLFPYLYALAHVATKTGAPLMRHPFLEHPDQPELRGVDDAYYFGPALYVAPVLERGARRVTPTLPLAAFLDWRDRVVVRRKPHTPTVQLPAPLDKLPLLLRENHLIPMLDASIDTLAEEDDPNIIGPGDIAHVYDVVAFMTRGGSASFALWDSDQFTLEFTDPLASPNGFELAADEDELQHCERCYQLQHLEHNLERIRFSTRDSVVRAGGLVARAQSRRRIRWDIYVEAEGPEPRAAHALQDQRPSARYAR
jgi:alpha-glucosidase